MSLGKFPRDILTCDRADDGASNLNVYVGTDNKIHFTDWTGADSALPFSGKTTHTETYTYPANSTGAKYDMGVDHTYRYVDATNVYTKGKADGDVKHSVQVKYNHYTASGFDAIMFYCYVDGKMVSNPSFDGSDENRIISVWSRSV